MNTIKNTPLVSVIVPVYNVAQYLERCLKSILSQTYSNLEIILINDGSTDASGNICDSYQKKDSRIHVIHKKNGGQSAARNAAMEIMQGDFVLFVDSDDWLKPQMAERLLTFATENDLSLVECGILNSRDLTSEKPTAKEQSFVESQQEAMRRLLLSNNFSVWRRIYAKEIVVGRKFIPGKINEDVFFTIDSINVIKKQGFVADRLYIYNTENISTTRSPFNLKKLDAKDALYYIVEKTNLYTEDIKTLANQYLLRGLFNNYNPLFTHAHLDPDLKLRKKLKEEINCQIRNMTLLGIPSKVTKLEYFFALKLPFWLYGFLRKLNNTRVSIKTNLFKSNNV